MALLYSACSSGSTDKHDNEAAQYADKVEKPFTDAITTAANDWARAAVTQFFDAVVSITTRADEPKFHDAIVQFEPSKKYEQVECSQLNALVAAVCTGDKSPSGKGVSVPKTERDARIEGAMNFASDTVTIQTAAALLRRV